MITITFLLSLALSAQAQVPLEQQIAMEFLSNATTLAAELGRVNQLVTPAQYCDFQATNSDFCRHVYKTSSLPQQSKQLCQSIGNAFETNASLGQRFCASVENSCQEQYPNRFIENSSGFSIASCRNETSFNSGGLPCHSSNQVIEERRADPLVKKQIFESAGAIFQELTSASGDFSNNCCQNHAAGPAKQSCRDNLAQTAFRVGKREDLNALGNIPGLSNSMRSIAQTISKRDPSNPRNVINTMIISEDLLLSHLDHHSLRNLILHELTHACQISRHVPEGPDAMDSFLFPVSGSTRQSYLQTLRSDISNLVGANYLSCIEESMSSSMPAGADEALWLKEVLAEAHNSSRKSDPRAWAMSCFQTHSDSHQDHLHPPRDLVLGCLLKHKRDDIRSGLGCR